MNLTDKKEIVAQLKEVADQSASVVVGHNLGLLVPAITKLRKEARNSGVYLQVVRNTLARRAVEGTKFECIADSLTGPVILAFSKTELSAAARLLRDFAKENDKLVIQALSIGGTVLGPDQVAAVATLPTYEEAISKLMSVMQAPIAKLAQTLNGVPSKLVRTLDAVREQKAA